MFTLTSLQEYFDSLYGKDLPDLAVPCIDLETKEKYTKPLLSCLGRDIALKDVPDYYNAIRWFMQKVAEDFYKSELNYGNSYYLWKQSWSGVNPYWRFFDIAEHPKYNELGDSLRLELLQRHTGDTLTGGYSELVELARNGHYKAIQQVNDFVAEYLIGQLIIDYAYNRTNGYQTDKFHLSKGEFDELIRIAKERHKRQYPISQELQAFLVYNIDLNKRSGGTLAKLAIEDSIDYRIMFMLKGKTERAGLSFAELASAKPKGFNIVIDEVCENINSWGYFKTVSPTANGSSKANAISSVRSRYFAEHPV